jgi:hypothetical protein
MQSEEKITLGRLKRQQWNQEFYITRMTKSERKIGNSRCSNICPVWLVVVAVVSLQHYFLAASAANDP